VSHETANHKAECECPSCRQVDVALAVALDQMRAGLRMRKARREAVRAAATRTGRHPYEREPETAQGNSEARRMK
jgi:hypothetical protein